MNSERRSPWQQPASCELCRRKKIRCDKRRPCASCTTREVECRYADSAAAAGGNVVVGAADRHASLEQTVGEMDVRLKRLEALLLRVDSSGGDNPVPRGVGQDTSSAISQTCNRLETLAASADIIHRPVLEREGSRLAVQLPALPVARVLFEQYVHTADCLHREIHIPSTRALMETTYTELMVGNPVPDETLAFFLAIFASSAFYNPNEEDTGYSSSSSTSTAATTSTTSITVRWREAAIAYIIGRQGVVSPSMITLQCLSILLYLLWDAEGQSAEFHALRGLAYAQAIQLGIHRDTHSPNPVETELRRRLWWHLASTDWLIATVPGSYEGVYTFHPGHFSVPYPVNLDDGDIVPGAQGKSADQPTEMSYVLHRIQFAALCRDAMDALRQVEEEPMRYEVTLRMSGRFLAFLDALPWFFQPESTVTEVEIPGRPYLARQRSALLYGLFSRLGRLHRPYALQAFENQTYAASRTIGVQCAEQLLQIHAATRDSTQQEHQHQHQQQHQRHQQQLSHSHSMDQHSFNALLLLSMEAIKTQSQPRKQELVQLCRAFQVQCSSASGSLIRALDQLIEMLLHGIGQMGELWELPWDDLVDWSILQ
ncbi:hypothetical protein ASPZODRAFT_132665 [Penicilliopsis zonata CBS 506.65]|uniref:Zn(2)-C6 fungal-type domain-containing protein n=1 Tax=Penicilliopsis zonata CBS 506.65 TaxID=1073090 RepID=A0A1L9SHA4_9EURO|nr:hypothetical protein ASPZODRAFT_132665 [Penicilliopsis zonata CBS 506.65]OJJ46592.1 hypothetical protein ASPZODRAFT_132665 [Penicilliopsis zonata CBS 506.65]